MSFLAKLTDLGQDLWIHFEVYAHRLVSWAAGLSQPAAAVLAVLGLIAAVVGGQRPVVRWIAAATGAFLALIYFSRLAPWLQWLHLPVAELTVGAAAVLAAFGAALPEGVAFLVVGLLLGLLVIPFFGAHQRTLVFIPTFLLGGTCGAVFFPVFMALISAFGGGLLFAAGVASALQATAPGPWLLHHPLVTAELGLAVGLAGFVGQRLAPGSKEQRSGSRSPRVQRSNG